MDDELMANLLAGVVAVHRWRHEGCSHSCQIAPVKSPGLPPGVVAEPV